MSSFIPWVGGKRKLLPYIQKLAPPRPNRFIDVFGGSATVTLGLILPKNCLKIYNDFNSNLTNLVFCVKYKPISLIKELGFLDFNSRDNFTVLQRFLEGDEFLDECLEEEMALAEQVFPPLQASIIKKILLEKSQMKDVRRAAAYYQLIRYSYSGNTNSFGGKPCNIRSFFYQIWDASRKLKHVVIENKDFASVIGQYDRDGGFIYCDPPYYEAEDCYEIKFPQEDHLRLREAILECKGFVMLSYNYCDFICDLYKDFFIFYLERPNSMSSKEGSTYNEAIICNYDPRCFSRQMSLFGISIEEKREFELRNIPEMPFGKTPDGIIIFNEENIT